MQQKYHELLVILIPFFFEKVVTKYTALKLHHNRSKVSYFFISREKLLLEWYSEKRSEWVKSAVFFFSTLDSGGKKKIFLTEKNILGYFSAKLSISDRKKQRYFSKLSTPIFLPKLWITDEKTKIIFWPKLGISDGNKKIPPYFCKNCLFLAEIKNTHYFCQNRQKVAPEKKNTATHEKEWVSAFSIFSREKKNTTPLIGHLVRYYVSPFWG